MDFSLLLRPTSIFQATDLSFLLSKCVWKSSCQYSHIFFLAASPRQSLAQGTSYRRKNMSFPPYRRYVLYNSQCDETVKHLFLGCPFSDYWNWLLSLQVSLDYTPFVVLERLKVQLSIPFFPEIILLCWSIVWSVRNNFFWGEAFFLSCYKFIFKSVFPLVILRGKSTISLWLLQE
jgi:hypothetical protein